MAMYTLNFANLLSDDTVFRGFSKGMHMFSTAEALTVRQHITTGDYLTVQYRKCSACNRIRLGSATTDACGHRLARPPMAPSCIAAASVQYLLQ
jgi:hypothetical protein